MAGAGISGRLTSATAASALAAACHEVGLDPSKAQLIRIGENALYAMPSERLVVRIARSVDLLVRVQREVDTARWLASLEFPAVRVADRLPQPLQVEGRPVTFWEMADVVPGEAASLADLGRILKSFHALPPPPFALASFDPFSVVPRRLADPGPAAPRDVEVLRELYDVVAPQFAALTFHLEPGLMHGDAHRANLLVTQDGVLLSDFEVVAHGPREWDLTPTALSRKRFRLSETDYASFVEAYGWDVTTWDGFAVLSAVRELTMTTWLMQNIAENQDVADEFTHRVQSLREGNSDQAWHAF